MEYSATSPEVLLTFYRRLYPFRAIFTWLNHSHVPSNLFTHREFAFTLPGDVYLRYNSFASHDDLKKQVLSYNPSRFEIGPVYSARPRDKKTLRPGAFKPVQRELVFDIDMTDYDDVRTCCSGADICHLCWGFISAAATTLHTALTEQFGFKHVLWVYSGRRGIHCWVSDKAAMELSDESRKAIVGWLGVVGGKESGKKVNVRGKGGARALPPSVSTALNPLATTFTSLILTDQDTFASESGYEALLSLISDHAIASTLRSKWSNEPGRSSEEKWKDLKKEIKKYPVGSSQRITLTHALEDIILTYTYPRLDAEVSKHRNHLLKAPFCVHPKTGKVCVPLSVGTTTVPGTNVEGWKPEECPTIGQLLSELDEVRGSMPTGEGMDGEHHSDWERTSLRPYINILETHNMAVLDEVRKDKREAGESRMDMSW